MKSLFNQIGLSGAGLILILIGIALLSSNTTDWGAFCLTLGISCLAFSGVEKSSGIFQVVVGIISAGSFVAAIVILLTYIF
jgi:hypothetical protein